MISADHNFISIVYCKRVNNLCSQVIKTVVDAIEETHLLSKIQQAEAAGFSDVAASVV